MLTRVDRHSIAMTFRDLRTNYRSMYLIVPHGDTECDAANCGFDEMTQSAKDSSCTVCNGIGKITTWEVYEATGRIQYVDFARLAGAGLPPGVEIGDVILYVSSGVRDVMSALKSDPKGYVMLDGSTFRPFSIAPTGVGQADDWRIELRKYEPSLKAAGY